MSDSRSPITRGYLVLADISGYTSFISQTELDHAQEILSDLLETILKRFKSLLTIHKIEGDAVFAYTADARLVRGETLLELIESTYVDFRDRVRNVRRHTTCTCRACQSIPMLDLKFVLHHGDYVVQDIGGTAELAGSDVNLVHRLLKNHVAENTGWRAYALLTASALDCLGVHPQGLVEGVESYEHLGAVPIHVMDLHARYEVLLGARRVVVEPADAIISLQTELPASPPEVWSWLNEPEKRRLITLQPNRVRFIPILQPGGRTAVGAVTHCVHGAAIDMRETVLDWKPFDYFTVEQDNGAMGLLQLTMRLEPLADGSQTRLQMCLKGDLRRVPSFLNRPLIKFIYSRVLDYKKVGLQLKQLLTEAAGAT